MGAGSPAGSDTDTSSLGIVQGHAYSILDVCEIEGNKLIQLRNPWGDEHEWIGAWGDASTDWNERRKRIVYERMKQQGQETSYIGENDGIFWMSISDFTLNFDQLFICKVFDSEWTQLTYHSEWSNAKQSAGGCSNNATFCNNPQLKLSIKGNKNVEMFMHLQTSHALGQKEDDELGIGFEIYDTKGLKGTNNTLQNSIY